MADYRRLEVPDTEERLYERSPREGNDTKSAGGVVQPLPVLGLNRLNSRGKT